MTFELLKSKCLACRNCSLCETRINTVFGTGNQCAEIMFVGEAPGRFEDEQGLPFVGRSGKLLDVMLQEIELYRDKNIFITNIVKCRPPENKNPTPSQWAACVEHLYAQIELISPKIVVCLGRIAAQRLISSDFKIMAQHGEWFLKRGIFFTATIHPAAILRNQNNLPLAQNDYQIIKAKIQEICKQTYSIWKI